MAKTKVSEWSTTPSSNTDIDGINIAEGCAPSGINDAIRDMMAQIRSWQSGTYGDTFNGPVNGTVGATTPATGAFTTLSASSTVTLSGGTANGVTYLNGSKVLTSGSALTFDGTNLLVGSGTAVSLSGYTMLSQAKGSFGIVSGNDEFAGAILRESSSTNSISIQADPANLRASSFLGFGVDGSEGMRLTSTGLGIGTSSPAAKLDVSGTNNGTQFVISPSSSRRFYFKTQANGGYDNAWLSIESDSSVGGFKFANSSATLSTLDFSGNLGLGVTPSAWGSGLTSLDLKSEAFISGGGNYLAILSNAYFNSGAKYKTTGYNATQYLQQSGAHTWSTAPSGTAGSAITFTQAMTLDASGNLLVGGTSTASLDGVFGAVIGGSSKSASGISIESSTSQWLTYTDSYQAMIFYDARLNAERARIDSSGNFSVGSTSNPLGDRGLFAAPQATQNTLALVSTDDASGGAFIIFRNSAYTAIGSVARVTTTNAVVYNTTSDYRLKTVTGAVTGQGARIDALKPIDYLWTEGGQQARGFLAHEFQEVYPNSVTGDKDAVDANGNPVYQAMQASTAEVIADLVAEIKALRVRVAQLESN